jgi:hypothetical protein
MPIVMLCGFVVGYEHFGVLYCLALKMEAIRSSEMLLTKDKMFSHRRENLTSFIMCMILSHHPIVNYLRC